MTALPTLKQLQYLAALSSELNFTRAAEACFVTQSTLSAGLKELESGLGVQLVERDKQTVFLTPIGEQIAERAQSVLTASHDLVALATEAMEPMTGYLRLGVIPTIAPFLLPACLQSLRTRFPKLRLCLREDQTANLLNRLEDGQLDFALIALPYDTRKLQVHTIFTDELWIVGRPRDLKVNGKKIKSVTAIADRLLLLEEGHCLRNHTLHACAASNPHHESTLGIEATSLLTLVQMIESGLGIGLIPEMAIRSGLTESPNLVAYALAKPKPVRTIALLARSSTSRLAELNILIEMIQNHYPTK